MADNSLRKKVGGLSMVIAQRFQPSSEDLAGNPKAFKKLEECIVGKVAVIIYGTPGIGKTSGVYAIARKLGLKVVETNSSDSRRQDELEDCLRKVKMRGFRPLLFLFDEIDGAKNGKMLADIVGKARHPVVFTANELWKVPQILRGKCETVRFYRPSLHEVLGRVRKVADSVGKKAQYDKVSQDIRASINAVLFGGDKYQPLNMFEFVESILRGGAFDVDVLDFNDRRNLGIWLADNLPQFYSGKRLWEAYELLSLYDVSKRFEVLKLFPVGRRKKPNYPFYLRRLKVLRGGNGD